MTIYRVKPGYCLHLPHGRFVHPGEEVELAGPDEQEVLETQGWKVEPVTAPEEKPEPAEAKMVDKPPRDRAMKGARAK